MSTRRQTVFAMLCTLVLACAPLPATADNHKNRGQGNDDSGGCLPLKRVIKSVSQQYGGRVLDADHGGSGVYRVRLLTGDGQVLDIAVDCATGQVLGVRGGS